jgi:Tfp pilus assembly protein PilF
MPRRNHDAEGALKKAIEMEPSKADYHVALGDLYLKSGLKTRALSAFKEALNWDPDSVQAKEGIIAAGG